MNACILHYLLKASAFYEVMIALLQTLACNSSFWQFYVFCACSLCFEIFSLSGRMTLEGTGAYSMSKHALLAYSDTLRQEMRKWDVHVAIIEPGAFRTGENGFTGFLSRIPPLQLRV